jgi:hypothetical protein
MSITRDLGAYADAAVSQGKQAFSRAQEQLGDISEQASELVARLAASAAGEDAAERLRQTLHGMRTGAEQAIHPDAIAAAVGPYVAKARNYGQVVTERTHDALAAAKQDERVAKLLATAGSLGELALQTVRDTLAPFAERGKAGSAGEAPDGTSTSAAKTAPHKTVSPAKAAPRKTAAAGSTAPASKAAPRKTAPAAKASPRGVAKGAPRKQADKRSES